MRVVRLVFGLYIGWQSIAMKEWGLGLAGLFIAGTALLNMVCCGIYGCQPLIKKNPAPSKEIIYEEVVA